MLEIRAKENATIQIVDNKFPLGLRDVMRIYIDDEVLVSKLKLKGSGQCSDSNNLFSYGQFNTEDSINNVQLSNITEARIVSGIISNFSRCLYVNFVADSSSIKLSADKGKLRPGIEYMFSFLCTNPTLTKVNCGCGNTACSCDLTITKSKYENGWYLYTSNKFTVDEETDFELVILGDIGEVYIDNVSAFDVSNELVKPAEDMQVELEVINPKQCIDVINNVIKWHVTEDDVYVALHIPPITVADYQDSIACILKFYQPLVGEYKMFGDIVYTDNREMIYQSEVFKLQGYILPVDVDWESQLELRLSIEDLD